MVTATLALTDSAGPTWWAQAWTVKAGNSATVFIRRPFQRFFFSLARSAHELGHAVDEGHSKWYLFDLRSPIALRFRWTGSVITKEQARTFLDRKVIDLAGGHSP